MSFIKESKDRFYKGRDKFVARIFGQAYVPVGLSELNRYFRTYGPINFAIEKQDDGSLIVISKNFQYGTIISSAKSKQELDSRIEDAILTAFEVPSSYSQEAGLHRLGKDDRMYVLASEGEYAFA